MKGCDNSCFTEGLCSMSLVKLLLTKSRNSELQFRFCERDGGGLEQIILKMREADAFECSYGTSPSANSMQVIPNDLKMQRVRVCKHC